MPLFEVPTELERIGITIMDGPFFSIMPFPDKKLHTLHHVRYTPLISSSGSFNMKPPEQTDVIYMIKDAQRYIPLLKDLKYKGSLYEVKTVLMINELSDARPILFKKDYRMDNFYVVMGGKIDNVYDILSRMEKIFKNT
jgi:hypothetical protein